MESGHSDPQQFLEPLLMAKALIAAVVVAVLLLTIPAADGAYPGENGRIVASDRGIHTFHPDGSHVRKLPGTDNFDIHPRWSPSGRWILFTCMNKDAVGKICKMRPDGSDRQRVGDLPRDNFGPVWSPNGKRIAFTHYGTKNRGGIWLMHADGTHVRRLTRDLGSGLSWGVNRKIVYNTDAATKIMTIRLDGTNKRELGSGWGPQWSPDGKRIAFITYGNDQDDESWDAYTMGAHGGNVERIRPWVSASIAWSPDGRYFVGSDNSGNVARMKVDGSKFRYLDLDHRLRSPDWGPAANHKS